MKRKLITLFLALALTLGAAVPTFAAGYGRRPSRGCGSRHWRPCWYQCCPSAPSCPSQPGKPEKPDTPDVPVEPEKPDIPVEPEKPDTPDVPVEPEKPDVPVEPEKPDVPEQPDTPDEDDGVYEQERQVVELVNRERAAYGLPPLTLDAELCKYARVKSQDLHDSGYFDHYSPNYGSPFDMMRQFGITYSAAGENIAKGYSTAEAVVKAWMASEGHRENILSAKYSTIGVGYVADGGYWTQWFIG